MNWADDFVISVFLLIFVVDVFSTIKSFIYDIGSDSLVITRLDFYEKISNILSVNYTFKIVQKKNVSHHTQLQRNDGWKFY